MIKDYLPVLLVGTLNTLAEKTAKGFVEFETYADAPSEYKGWVVYDKANMKVVCNCIVDECDCAILGYYNFYPDVEIHVIEDGDNRFIEVLFFPGTIVIENGRWYLPNLM